MRGRTLLERDGDMPMFSARNSEKYKMVELCDIWRDSSDNSVFLVRLSLFSRPKNHPIRWEMCWKRKLTKLVKMWTVLHLKFATQKKRHLKTYCARNQESCIVQPTKNSRRGKKINSITSENCLIVYFNTLHKIYAPTTLWAVHSMLKTMIKTTENIDIGNSKKLLGILKNYRAGYKPKKARTFTGEKKYKQI